jgi:hypothetical protein
MRKGIKWMRTPSDRLIAFAVYPGEKRGRTKNEEDCQMDVRAPAVGSLRPFFSEKREDSRLPLTS